MRDFFRSVNAGLLLFSIVFVSLFIWLNYRYGIERGILQATTSQWGRFLRFYGLYLVAFAVPVLVALVTRSKPGNEPWKLLLLMVAAPAIFAAKVSFQGFTPLIQQLHPGAWGRYWALVVRLPVKLLLVTVLLFIVWKADRYEPGFFGLMGPVASWKPYFLLLLMMVPLVAWASFQPAFLHTYPKVEQIRFIAPYTTIQWPWKLLYELSYGLDFVTIELFFRGFLVLGFLRFLGQDAIITMAAFYCTIHFGKPLAECISSFFGGLLLGIIVYHTRSIAGGVIVHLGIAWMMEAGGWLAKM